MLSPGVISGQISAQRENVIQTREAYEPKSFDPREIVNKEEEDGIIFGEISNIRPETNVSDNMPKLQMNYKEIEKKYSPAPLPRKIPGQIMKQEVIDSKV